MCCLARAPGGPASMERVCAGGPGCGFLPSATCDDRGPGRAVAATRRGCGAAAAVSVCRRPSLPDSLAGAAWPDCVAGRLGEGPSLLTFASASASASSSAVKNWPPTLQRVRAVAALVTALRIT